MLEETECPASKREQAPSQRKVSFNRLKFILRFYTLRSTSVTENNNDQ